MKMVTLLALFVFVLTISCHKPVQPSIAPDNPYGLPNATTTGSNIFACRAGNENWIAKKGLYTLGGNIHGDSLSVSGSSGTADYFDRLLIRIDGGVKENTQYTIPADSPLRIGLSTNRDCNGSNSNLPIAFASSGFVRLTTIDPVRKIFAGEFACKIPVPGCDTIVVSYGRFDMSY